MDSYASKAIGGAIEGLFNALAFFAIASVLMFVTIIGMGIYIYVH
jgi:hypothetical protein